MTSSRFAAVFFDAGETLVHPHPTFPDLFAQILRREGHDVSPETIRERGHVVFDRFRAAADANELWTTSPERSRRFWHDVYGIFLRELGIPDANGLIDVVYTEFTDLANYRLFDDVRPVLDRLRDAGLVLGVVSNFEEWLARHPAVDEAAVVGEEDERLGQRVVAYVVCAGAVTPEALDAHCLASPTLARFKRPRDYRFVDALPKSASGKLLRRLLRTTEGTT